MIFLALIFSSEVFSGTGPDPPTHGHTHTDPAKHRDTYACMATFTKRFCPHRRKFRPRPIHIKPPNINPGCILGIFQDPQGWLFVQGWMIRPFWWPVQTLVAFNCGRIPVLYQILVVPYCFPKIFFLNSCNNSIIFRDFCPKWRVPGGKLSRPPKFFDLSEWHHMKGDFIFKGQNQPPGGAFVWGRG